MVNQFEFNYKQQFQPKHMSDKFLNQSGSIMVISVLLMSIMSVVAFGLSTVIIKQVDFSRNFDYALLAYYGAESSMEQTLYDARKRDLVILEDGGTLTNDVEWSRIIDPVQEELTFQEILENRFVQVDLFDPDDVLCESVATTGIECLWESMIVTWEGTGSIETTVTRWDTGEIVSFGVDDIEEEEYLAASSPWILNDLESYNNYRLKIKAVFGDVENLTLTLYDQDNGSGEIVAVPNYLTIRGEGEYRSNKQALSVRVPRKAPLSSLYDYVLFSEEDIVKEIN